MSDPITLIPMLQEVMEEFIDLENQTKLDHQALAGHVENKDNENEMERIQGSECGKAI